MAGEVNGVSDDARASEDGSEPSAPNRRRRAAGKRRRKQRVNPRSIERWAVRHLDRYSSSASNLRSVLLRRVRRVEQAQEESFPEAGEWIDATVAALVSRGYLDDRKYALALATQMRERGNSARRIESQLTAKGVPRAVARNVIDDVSGTGGEIAAAVRYARRRRLGPYRLDPEVRGERRERDLAALGRSGFAYEIAARIIAAKDAEALESSLFERD